MSEAGTQGPVEAPGTAGDRSFARRLLGVLRLEGRAYDDVVADPAALGQAAVVVAAAAVARGIGAASVGTSSEAFVGALSVALFWPLGSALLWAIANWFGHPIGFQPLLRVVGFAMAPLALVALTAVDNQWLQMAVSLVATALFLAALVVGVRQALRVDTGRAAFVCVVLFLIVVLLMMIAMYLAAMLATAPPAS